MRGHVSCERDWLARAWVTRAWADGSCERDWIVRGWVHDSCASKLYALCALFHRPIQHHPHLIAHSNLHQGIQASFRVINISRDAKRVHNVLGRWSKVLGIAETQRLTRRNTCSLYPSTIVETSMYWEWQRHRDKVTRRNTYSLYPSAIMAENQCIGNVRETETIKSNAKKHQCMKVQYAPSQYTPMCLFMSVIRFRNRDQGVANATENLSLATKRFTLDAAVAHECTTLIKSKITWMCPVFLFSSNRHCMCVKTNKIMKMKCLRVQQNALRSPWVIAGSWKKSFKLKKVDWMALTSKSEKFGVSRRTLWNPNAGTESLSSTFGWSNLKRYTYNSKEGIYAAN